MTTKRNGRSDDGFTLVELLTVILIISIVAAIAVPSLVRARDRGVVTSMKSDLRNAATLMEIHFAEELTYPPLTQSGQTLTVGAESMRLSQGNVLVSRTGTGDAPRTFCIEITNDSASRPLYYDSDGGGVSDAGCR